MTVIVYASPRECPICFEDRVAFRECKVCRNLICGRCNTLLRPPPLCPFCRTRFPALPHRRPPMSILVTIVVLLLLLQIIAVLLLFELLLQK
jgi:hypothetical protein